MAELDILVIGAGNAGLGAAITLSRAGPMLLYVLGVVTIR